MVCIKWSKESYAHNEISYADQTTYFDKIRACSLFSSWFIIMMQSRDANKINSSNQESWMLSVKCNTTSYLLFADMDMDIFRFTTLQHKVWLPIMYSITLSMYPWIKRLVMNISHAKLYVIHAQMFLKYWMMDYPLNLALWQADIH